MRRIIRFALPLLLSLLPPAALVLADAPPASTFIWASTQLPASISLSDATAAADAYLPQAAAPDQEEFVQITNTERRGNVTSVVFYGWRLHYSVLVSEKASCGQPGLTLLVNGNPGVYAGGDGNGPFWPAGSVVADIPDPAPCPVPPAGKD
jgi:hypothetical protein